MEVNLQIEISPKEKKRRMGFVRGIFVYLTWRDSDQVEIIHLPHVK